ncbi:MAG: C10 family peptidase [Candidatus Zixiibacteriota bacterium]
MLKEFLHHARRFATAGFISLAIMILFSNSAFATIATENEMDQVCKNWLSQVVKELGSWGGSLYPEIENSQDIIENDTLLGRYYSISPSGFIVVPALRELAPVKAYSEETSLNINEDDGGMSLMFRQVLKSRMDIYTEIYGSLETTQTGTEPLFDRKNEQAWNEFTVSEKDFNQTMNKGLLGTTSTVGPLLSTVWHQSYPYNSLCPTGYLGRRCYVGCVSTAASQIIYYHQWPPEGTGSHSYYWGGDNDPDCDGSSPGQTLYADFSDPYTYDHSNASVAEISYEMGVAYEMNYGTCGSGAYTLEGEYIFPQYFQYDESASRAYRSSYSADGWFDLIKENIDKNRPTLYRIYSHAIVCDGWREIGTTKQYHMNYGWGGSQNSWYTLDNVYCPWPGCNPMVEGMVVNIIPLNGAPYKGGHEISDTDLGDGDGIPEAGETIKMYFTLANYGGAPLENISATLTIDDGTITITDDASFFALIPAFDSVTSYGDPFVFEIPVDYISRIDSFFINISWNGGQDTEQFSGAISIGSTNIILIDDDNYKTYENYFKGCFDNIRMPCSVWTYASLNPPPLSELNKYDFVIWFTGDDRATTLNSTNIATIKRYLDDGGNLFLTGQGIASQLAIDDPDLLNNYLKTEYQSGTYSPIIIAESGAQVLNLNDTLVVYGSSGADNQTNTERITPVNGGIAEARYVSGEHYAAVSYSGEDYKTVFFAFGFEAIRNDPDRFVSRDSMMAYIMDFFGTAGPPSPPSASGISVAPGDPDHMTDHIPDFSWSYYDGDAAPQSHYQIQVTSNADWYFIDMWDTGPVAGSETSATYLGSELMDGTTYFVRVRVSNSLYWSDWVSTDFAMNGLPDPPVGLSPDNEEMVTSSSPELSHDTAPDPDGLAVDYSYEVYADMSMTTLIASADDQPGGSNPVTWQVPVSLGEDQMSYWRVRADDALEDGTEWSELASFCVNASNQPPAPFELTNPDSAILMENLLPTFTWTATSDPDLNDEFTYMLRYSKYSDFASPKSFYDLTAEEYSLTAPLEYGLDYYWKVVATDLFGAQTVCSNIRIYMTMLEGDANADRNINVGDAVYLINHVFKSGPPPVPFIMGDANCDAQVNVGDAVYLINHAFKGGPPPGCAK